MTPAWQEANGTDDVEVDELEKLLLAAEAVEQEESQAQNDIKSVTPKLREDDSFAKEIGSVSFSHGSAQEPNSNAILNGLSAAEDLDSSDEEEMKNFLERKFNEYGRDINQKLKQIQEENKNQKVSNEVNKNLNSKFNSFTNGFKVNGNIPQNNQQTKFPPTTEAISATWQNKPPAAKTLVVKNPEPPIVADVYTEPIFGLRLIHPLVSSAILKERMSDRTPVTMPNITFHIERADLSKDWVVAGAIVSKSPIKTSKNGSPFTIWKLSDLKGDIKTISLFLFKNAHKELWKTAVGCVVAILNPGVFQKREERGDVASLSIDNPQKVMILGQSKDLGTCKSKKKNGEPCGAIVNMNDCEFCIFHVKQEFSRMSNRSELQSSTAGRGLNELRNKVLGKSEVFYGGQSYSAIPARKSAKQAAKDEKLLMTLSEYYQSPSSNAGTVNHISRPKEVKEIPYASKTGPQTKVASIVETNSKQRLKDLERLKALKGEEHQESTSQELNVPGKFKNREFSLQKTPVLSKDTFSFDLNFGTKNANQSKRKAVELIKGKPLEKSNPNFVKYRGTKNGKKRAIDELHAMDNDAKRRKLEDEKELERKSRIEKIMAATSSHTNLIKYRENEEQEKYFNKLEKKETLEEKMLSTFKVPCKAVICSKCKYTAFSAADRCKEERHPLKVVDAEKRFFQCEDCGNRTATVHKIPKLSCKNCKSSKWKRTAMIREKKTHDPNANLSIRGDEEKFIGSLQTNSAGLNLLVPE